MRSLLGSATDRPVAAFQTTRGTCDACAGGGPAPCACRALPEVLIEWHRRVLAVDGGAASYVWVERSGSYRHTVMPSVLATKAWGLVKVYSFGERDCVS